MLFELRICFRFQLYYVIAVVTFVILVIRLLSDLTLSRRLVFPSNTAVNINVVQCSQQVHDRYCNLIILDSACTCWENSCELFGSHLTNIHLHIEQHIRPIDVKALKNAYK